MIYFDDVAKVYDHHAVLDGVTLSIEDGEFVSIVGKSGAGKTTLLRLLLAEERPTSGSVFFESTNVHRIKQAHIPEYRRRLGTVFQDFRLLPNKTAYENIAFAMEAAGRADDEIRSDVPQVLDLVDLASKALHFPHELSGGEKQRVAIARAIISQPDVLIADEPTGNLDPTNTYDIIQILKKIHDMGTTVILTTHNKGIIDSLKRRVVTMEDGKIIRDDKQGKYIL
ncbi:MAG: cell division ATP-binding protein FtsE [Candidatus Lloydbacteria bacterium RIFCSPHIGHO2_02_FULL_54_17]|uniref:Cell division ATP-binding protein FtsE n=1 Tax=Candidatus Lloydbacteria bacterium RIFCSPHIGHO2_02_FULL_54_17 TaxID=1798664 RepID=A0A1G2DBC0_9BACT|nr:MAG: cell division ATP-binding protein FtsE [Candidatus Lloydbacteria bacterium RIFCSPHIGHO2_01_FULL_54_11]OGZ10924.1 MAG: cell division ATP-binding protein FtsE [Candidatus Lloydbacteria bacterium RIFCSPHIGHO2_02_FULL_54_17]OGZ14906.1 MAG: cell division ATP-binding protein FtsE [Candidatus Lloydbacteria bacterium RIFCSPLOWO2_01_FULL_54_18]OGZ15862.1 MAG: cell division ATP-binding protein FtsE [Candidatus Lloydbacteria bacterium RIFCSPLOWO2_02_FULL_54_12]